MYFKYTKLWKSVYFKYTKLNRWSRGRINTARMVWFSSDARRAELYLRLPRSHPYACIEDCAARLRSQRASLIVTSVSTQATSENAAPTAPT